MFVSPCSLRSTQCAALIALATVAGISRLEKQPHPTATDESPQRSSRETEVFRGIQNPPLIIATATWLWHFTRVDARQVAPDLFLGSHHTVAHRNACDADFLDHETRLATVSPAQASTVAFSEIARPALCTVSHLIPFAVGPPTNRISTIPNAVGTGVPGDSTAQGTSARSVSWVATLDVGPSEARIAHQNPTGRNSARLIPAPRSSHRGGTGTSPLTARFAGRLGAPARRGPFDFST